jgi:hypothetical protein
MFSTSEIHSSHSTAVHLPYIGCNQKVHFSHVEYISQFVKAFPPINARIKMLVTVQIIIEWFPLVGSDLFGRQHN